MIQCPEAGQFQFQQIILNRIQIDTHDVTRVFQKELNAAGGYSAAISYEMLGVKLPISVLNIQAMVTQPLKPVLNHVVSSGALLSGRAG